MEHEVSENCINPLVDVEVEHGCVVNSLDEHWLHGVQTEFEVAVPAFVSKVPAGQTVQGKQTTSCVVEHALLMYDPDGQLFVHAAIVENDRQVWGHQYVRSKHV